MCSSDLLRELVQRVRVGRLRRNIGNVAALDDAVAAFNRTERIKGKTIIRCSSVRTRGLPNAHEGAIHAPKIFTTLRTGMMMHSIDNLAQRGIACVPFFPLGGFNPFQSATLDGVADSLGATPTQAALAWLLLRES